MPINAERLRTLRDLGLTEAQGRAYLALLDLGTAPAKDVAALARVPKAKVYAALDALVGKGLAEVAPHHPKRYAPLPIDGYASALARSLHQRADGIAERAPELARDFAPSEAGLEPRAGFGVLRGRRVAHARVLELAASARERLVLRASPGLLARLARSERELDAALAAGADVLVLTPPALETARARAALGQLARVVDAPAPGDGDVSVVVADGAAALLLRSVPDDASLAHGDDVALWTRDAALARALEDLALASAPAAEVPRTPTKTI